MFQEDITVNHDVTAVALQKTSPSVDKIIYSSIAQSVERMTVNHDVTGSSPVRGAKCVGL